MKLNIINFGKIKNPEILKLENYYKKLASRYFQIQIINLKYTDDQPVNKEIIFKKKPDGFQIFLTEHGETSTSIEFAKWIYELDQEHRILNFWIGNAYGFTPKSLTYADQCLSLSPWTFPHEMVRVLLLEQLFRCGNIHQQGSYHK